MEIANICSMRFYTFAILLVLALGLGGCLSSSSKPLAVPQPLERVSLWPKEWSPSDHQRPIIKVSSDSLTVIGSRGDALNTAARLHQKLASHRIPNEILVDRSSRASESMVRTRLRLTFPSQLTDDQQKLVRQVMTGFQTDSV